MSIAGTLQDSVNVRYVFTISGTPTTVNGADDNSKTLAYTAGQADVYLNGVKQVVGTDVTATSGSSVVFGSALAANDIVEVVAFDTFQAATTGNIIQIVQMETDSLTSSNSTTFVDTAVTLNITPSSTSSKILGIATTAVGTDSDIVALTRVNNSTASAVVSDVIRYTPRSSALIVNHGTHTFLHAPSSTNAQTYVVQIASDRSATSYFNSRGGGSITSHSSIILMEVQG